MLANGTGGEGMKPGWHFNVSNTVHRNVASEARDKDVLGGEKIQLVEFPREFFCDSFIPGWVDPPRVAGNPG